MAAGLLSMLLGCGSAAELEKIGAEHRGAVAARAPVVVFLPGTLASELVNERTGERVWGRADALSVDPRTAEGLRQLSLPLTATPPGVSAADDDIEGSALLERAATRILGMRFSTPIYDDALAGFVAAGLSKGEAGRIPAQGPALVPFPYDWRRSIADGAAALAEALEGRGAEDRKVTLVGHSMGATVALYYLMYGGQPLDPEAGLPELTWEGARHVGRALLVAPPLRGSAVAIRNTVNGNKLAGPLVPVYPPAMLASHPSTFELMPRYDTVSVHDGGGVPRKGAHLDPDFWEARGWGLVGPSSAQHRQWLSRGADDPDALAAARQRDLMMRGRAFHAVFDRDANPPEGLELVVLAGKGGKTPDAVSITDEGKVEVTHHVDGDGVVPFTSAAAGFMEAAPGRRLVEITGPHARILSEPEVFRRLMELIGE